MDVFDTSASNHNKKNYKIPWAIAITRDKIIVPELISTSYVFP